MVAIHTANDASLVRRRLSRTALNCVLLTNLRFLGKVKRCSI